MDNVQAIVIGAGVIGLAAARALAVAGLDTIILEREPNFGSGISSRNSEVIHAGIYYAPGSLKAELCVRGKALLYEYCRMHKVSFRRCGKLIVAPAESGTHDHLEALHHAARSNGVDDTIIWTAADVQKVEPALTCGAALWSPSTGIIDTHGYMLSLLGVAEDHGAVMACRHEVLGVRPAKSGFVVSVGITGTEMNFEISAPILINAAGLDASHTARCISGFPAAAIPETYMAKGSYFALLGPCPFSHLIYPLPQDGGLGVHLTLDLGGQARFGPNVEWVSEKDFAVRPDGADEYYEAIRTYWPGLRDGTLAPAYAGIRPKLVGPGERAADFLISNGAEHGFPGLINLFGIESPGITASLAIAERVVELSREVHHA